MRYFLRLKPACLVAVLLTFCLSSYAAPFAKGDMGVSITLGSGQAFNDNYTILGAGVGYYLVDGLKLGLDVEVWSGGDVSIKKISPQVQYVFSREKKLKPYVGAFYRKTSIDGFDDLNSAGGRAGLFFSNQGSYYMGIGIVHETYQSCDESVFASCSDTYPELSFTFLLK